MQENIKVYMVGGAVRDKLLGIDTPKDIDYAVEAPSWEAMRQYIIDKGGEIFLETPQYFTIRAKIGKTTADYVLCRKDGEYLDGRHPENVCIGTIFDDLSRRDLTINSLAINCGTGAIIDLFNGQQDIKDRILRFVGNASDRLREDKLRSFRIIRFSVTKNFTMDHSATQALWRLDHHRDFEAVSTERIREELLKMFKVNSKESFYYIFDQFPELGRLVITRGIWFKPTTEEK